MIAVGVPRHGWPPVQESWLDTAPDRSVTVPMLAIAHGCGVADELHWPDGPGIVQPKQVRGVWLGCW